MIQQHVSHARIGVIDSIVGPTLCFPLEPLMMDIS